MAEHKGGSDGGGVAVVGLLAVCVVLGMASGARGVIRASSSQTANTSSHVVVENTDHFSGTFQVRTDSCQDAPGVPDLAHVAVSNGTGVVAEADAPVTGTAPVEHVSVGQSLPQGTYRVGVQCLSDGQPVGDVFASTVTASSTGITQSSAGSSGQQASTDQQVTNTTVQPSRLPASGR